MDFRKSGLIPASLVDEGNQMNGLFSRIPTDFGTDATIYLTHAKKYVYLILRKKRIFLEFLSSINSVALVDRMINAFAS